MFLYITLGTNNLQKARPFYDAVMSTLGHKVTHESATEVGYGRSAPDVCRLYVTLPFNEKPATTGNGSMPAFEAPTRAAVDAFHKTALAHGGSDEGAPGLRYSANFYSCYVRDLDGNKLSAVCMQAE